MAARPFSWVRRMKAPQFKIPSISQSPFPNLLKNGITRSAPRSGVQYSVRGADHDDPPPRLALKRLAPCQALSRGKGPRLRGPRRRHGRARTSFAGISENQSARRDPDPDPRRKAAARERHDLRISGRDLPRSAAAPEY